VQAQALLELVTKQAALAQQANRRHAQVAKTLELATQHSKALAQADEVVSELDRTGLLDQMRRMASMIEAARAQSARAVAEVRVAVCRGRRVRPGVRPRASRGRSVRLRGSRRTTRATRAGPSGDPDLADSERPPSREGAAI